MPEQNTSPTTPRSPHPLRGLLALNGALLLILAVVTLGSLAQGQPRGRGEFTMASGGMSSGDSPAIWIIDVANQEMIAMMYNANTRKLEGLSYRSLAADAAGLQQGRSRPTP